MPGADQFVNVAVLWLILASLGVWVGIAVRLGQGRPIVRFEPRRPAPWSGLDVLLVGAIFIVSQVFAFGMALRVAGLELHDAGAHTPLPIVLAASAVANLVTLAAALAITVWRAGAAPRDLGWHSRAIGRDAWRGVVAFVAAAAPVYMIQLILIQWYPSEHPLVRMLRGEHGAAIFALGVITAVVVAPVVEEFLFRVLLQGWLEAKETALLRAHDEVAKSDDYSPPPNAPQAYSDSAPREVSTNPYQAPLATLDPQPVDEPAVDDETANELPRRSFLGLPRGWWPILASSSVFAALHVGHGPDPIPLFVLAVILGYLYRQTHRILPSLVVHACLNSVSMAMLGLQLFSGK